MRSFFVAGASNTIFDKPFYGSWNRLLNTLFPPDTLFEVVPQYFPPSAGRDSVDFVVLLLIYIETSPVFIVEVKPPKDSRFASKREEADLQMRQRFCDCAAELRVPILHGVCTFGAKKLKLVFYKYHQGTKILQPRRITPDPDTLTDTAPKDWWDYDILEDEGADRFRAVVEDMKMMSAILS